MNPASAPAKPDVIAIRFRLQYPDVDTFVAKYAANISEGGIFIASMEPPAVGTTVRFELSIAGGQPILRGEGEVVWNAPFDPLRPMDASGMSIRFQRLDADGVALIRRVLAFKTENPELFVTAAPDPYATDAYRPHPPSTTSSLEHRTSQRPDGDTTETTQPTESTKTPVPGDTEPRHAASHPSTITPAALDEELADLLKPKAASSVTPADASKKLAELLDRRLRPSRT